MTPRRRIVPLFVPHAGCPNDCVFCDQKRISGSLFPVSADTVRRTLSALPPGAACEAAFYGGSFTATPPALQTELLTAAQPFLADGRISALRVSTRPDAVDGETLARLRAYGVQTVELGAQSMCDEVLRRSGRGHTVDHTRRAAALVRESGFRLILQMMTGLPGSSDERDTETARQLIALRPEGVRVYPTVILRDTPLAELWRAGLYREHTVEDAVRVCAALLPLFERAGIPVIRLGLNPTEELSGGGVLGGAYHPALGELVRSRILLYSARALLGEGDRDADVTLVVAQGQLSAMIGQHRCNVDTLRREFGLRALRVVPGNVPVGTVLRR